MDQIEKAAVESLKNPGKSNFPLPKDTVGPSDNFVVVFRHGESEDNVRKIFSGWRDATELTQKGIGQAKVLSPQMNKLNINEIIMSDQVRSQHTARLAFVSHPNLENIKWKVDWRIKERKYGDLQGKSKEEVMKMDPENAVRWRRGYNIVPPNGESMIMVEKRVWSFLDELVDRIRSEKINVALSASGNSMRAIRRYFEKMTILQEMTIENPFGTDFALYKIAMG